MVLNMVLRRNYFLSLSPLSAEPPFYTPVVGFVLAFIKAEGLIISTYRSVKCANAYYKVA